MGVGVGVGVDGVRVGVAAGEVGRLLIAAHTHTHTHTPSLPIHSHPHIHSHPITLALVTSAPVTRSTLVARTRLSSARISALLRRRNSVDRVTLIRCGGSNAGPLGCMAARHAMGAMGDVSCYHCGTPHISKPLVRLWNRVTSK